MKIFKSSVFLIFALLAISCGKEEFTAKTQQESFSASSNALIQLNTCAQRTLIKPRVDLLFVVDNSLSTRYLSDQTKGAIKNFLNNIPLDRYDFHIMVAPLLGSATTIYPIAVSNTDGLSAGARSRIKSYTDSNFMGFSNEVEGPVEDGFNRAYNLINSNVSSGIFRSNAYTLVVLISNEDDDKYMEGQPFYSASRDNSFFNTAKSNFQTLRDTRLNSIQFRFFSIVSHTTKTSCQGSTSVKPGYRYMRMSRDLYNESGATDQAGRSHPDSYDICNVNFVNMFQDVGNSIEQVLISHVYDWWPVTTSSCLTSASQILEVKKDNGSVLVEGDPNGYTFEGSQTNRNMRESPPVSADFPAETYTGKMIRLYGSGKVTYPECMMVRTETPYEQFGYIVISREPDLSTVVIKKNGSNISRSGSNGWEYIGHGSINIKISPSVPGCTATDPINKTGYIFRLNGSATYTNNDTVQVLYKSAPTN